MSTRHWFTTAITSLNHERLKQEVNATGIVCEWTASDLTANSRVGLDLELATLTPAQQTTLQGVIDAHDGTDYVAQQRTTAETRLKTMWGSVQELGVDDAVIIVWARRLAQIRGDIVTINTKADAAAYWDGEMSTAGNEAGRLRVQRDSFQALLELVSVALVR